MKSVYPLAFSHCRSTRVLESTLRDNININDYTDKDFEFVFAKVHGVFKDVRGLGPLATVDVTLDILRFHGIVDERKFLVGSGDVSGIKTAGLAEYVESISVSGVRLKYIRRVYLEAAFS
jgi:hypothetical protein